MRRLFIIASAITLLLSGCKATTEFLFDTPFVSIADKTKLSTSTVIDIEANNLLSELCISLVAGGDQFLEPVIVEYELIIGDGLKEGVDFTVQPSTASPITFNPGTYDMPVRIIWKYNKDFDPTKNGTLEVRLTSCSIEGSTLGYIGPDAVRRSFIFKKQ